MLQSVARPVPKRLSLAGSADFTTLIAGQFVSRAGDALLSLAVIWLALDLSHGSPLAGSAAAAFEFLPYLLFGLVGGVLVDRWDRRRTMIATDAVRGLLLLGVPLLYASGQLQIWHVYALSFVLSSIGRLFTPARQALIPDLVDADQLTRANAIAEGSSQAAWIVGPALGGVLVATIGAANVFTLDAASFFISALTLCLITVRSGGADAGRGRASLWQEAAGGLRHVWRTPVLSLATLLSILATVAFAPIPALLPVLVRGPLGLSSGSYGVLMACFFAGSVATSVLVARRGERLHRGRTLALGTAGIATGTAALALAPNAPIAGALLVLLGGSASAFNVAEASLLQEHTPAELRGRVFAVSALAAQILRPATLVGAGLVAGLVDVRFALGLLAVTAIVAAAVGFLSRTLRRSR
jgi:MFS family permease